MNQTFDDLKFASISKEIEEKLIIATKKKFSLSWRKILIDVNNSLYLIYSKVNFTRKIIDYLLCGIFNFIAEINVGTVESFKKSMFYFLALNYDLTNLFSNGIPSIYSMNLETDDRWWTETFDQEYVVSTTALFTELCKKFELMKHYKDQFIMQVGLSYQPVEYISKPRFNLFLKYFGCLENAFTNFILINTSYSNEYKVYEDVEDVMESFSKYINQDALLLRKKKKCFAICPDYKSLNGKWFLIKLNNELETKPYTCDIEELIDILSVDTNRGRLQSVENEVNLINFLNSLELKETPNSTTANLQPTMDENLDETSESQVSMINLPTIPID